MSSDRRPEGTNRTCPTRSQPRFFDTVAIGRGVNVQVLTREDEALGWLSHRG